MIFGLWYGLRSPRATSPQRPKPRRPLRLLRSPKRNLRQRTPQPSDRRSRLPLPTEPAAAAAAAASAAPAAPPSSADPLAPPAEGKKVVIVKVRPADARFYYKGKKMGGSPMRVELAPGEKRAFEVGHPHFVTRKVVIDGSESEVIVGLHPKAASAIAQPKAPAGEPAEGLP